MNDYFNTLLISPTKVKSFGDIGINLDDSAIGAAIRISQNVYLKDIFGKDLVEHLQVLVYNKINRIDDSIDDSGNTQYKTLLDEFIQPALAYKTTAELATTNHLKIRSMGTVKNSDTNVQPVDSTDMKALAEYYMTFFYDVINKTWDFLCENKAAFSEIPEGFCSCRKKPLYGRTGLYLGK